MRTTAGPAGRGVLALALFAGLLAACLARAADDDAEARKAALKLNDLTGDKTVEAKIGEYRKKADDAKKVVAAAAALLKEKGKDQPFTPNATYVLARIAQDAKDAENSEKFYRLNITQGTKLQSGMKLGQAYLGLVALQYENRKYAEAEKACQEFLDIDLEDEMGNASLDLVRPLIIRRMVLTLAKQNNYDKANDLLDKLAQAQPGNPLNLDLRARVQREAGKYDAAVKTYEEMMTKVKEAKGLDKELRDGLLADVRYTLSGLYVEMKQIDKAAEQLKMLLEKEPDNPTYNNDLGFIWADNDKNLDESEKMIRKAIEEDRKLQKKEKPAEEPRDNPAYLDSLGWVLYKRGMYKEALPHLQAAVKDEDGRHTEIYDHLGDCLLKLGQKKEAVQAWQEALKVVIDTKRDKERKVEVEKKIQAHK